MAIPTVFSVGSVSLENGSTSVACHDSVWAGNVKAGDYLFVPGQPLVPAVRLATDGDDTGATLAWPWPGTDVVEGAYEVQQTPDGAQVFERMRRLLAALGSIANTGIGFDAFGEFSDRATHDAAAAGFVFLSTDGDGDTITDPLIFIRVGATTGVWSDPIEFRGPAGPQGVAGLIGVWKGPYSGVTAYDAKDVTREAGSAWIAKVPTTGNAPPTLPTTSNTWWDLVSQKGDPGDMTGPGASVAGHVAVYADTSGAVLADGGALGTAAALNAGTASGEVPVLDGAGKLPTSTIPALAISHVSVVASEAEMLALTAEEGDFAIRTDVGRMYILASNSPSTLADWVLVPLPVNAVLSVAGRTGNVVLLQADIGGLTTASSPQFAGVELGHATDTTLSRHAAGVIAVEGVPIYSGIPQNAQSAAYTLVLADAQKHLFHPAADTTARVWTIPANSAVAYPIGTAITFINEHGAGVVSIAINTDTLRLAGTGTTGTRTLAADGVATAIKVTATSWIISGVGLT